MPYQATVFKVLVASPGDVAAERKIVADVIASYNSLHSSETSAMLLPVRWEVDSVPQVGMRPQAALNKQLVETADVVVGIFWTRIGTPTGESASGAVEEIELAHRIGIPCLLYFSGMPVVPDNLDRDQFDRLQSWKKSIDDRALHQRYNDLGEFRELLSAHLVKTVRDLLGSSDVNGVPPSFNPTSVSSDAQASAMSRLRDELLTLETLWQAEKASSPLRIDDGQQLLYELGGLIRDALPLFTGEDKVKQRTTLAEILTGIRRAQEWRLYIDGGKSYRGFFDFGDGLLNAAQGTLRGD